MRAVCLALLSAWVFLISLSGCKPIENLDVTAYGFDRGTLLVDGRYTPDDHWEGRWKLVNVWARWCKPCWQEMPELNQFRTLQNPDGVQVLGYNFDQLEQQALKPLISEMNIRFPVLTSWPDVWEFPDIKGLPATLLIAPDNSLVKILWGPQTVASLKKEVTLAQATITVSTVK